MVWSVVREANDEDKERLERRAQAFCQRHDIEIYDGDDAVSAVEYHIDGNMHPNEDQGEKQDRLYLKTLWLRIVRRALGGQWTEGIAHGYIGFSV